MISLTCGIINVKAINKYDKKRLRDIREDDEVGGFGNLFSHPDGNCEGKMC